MPKQPIAVELEAINLDGEILVVRDSGYSVYLRSVEASGLALAAWVADSNTLDPAFELAKRLCIALAIPLTVQVPEKHLPVVSTPAASTSVAMAN